MFSKKSKTSEETPRPATPPAGTVPLTGNLEPQDIEKFNEQDTEISMEYPNGLKLVLVLTSAFLSMFLVTLDRLIVSTAIPRISDNFHSVNDIGWYGSAYLLTTCAFQLLFGKLYAFFSVKFVYMTAVLLFEVGSAICGAAPNSTTFIVGRAVAGLGGAGVTTGNMMIIFYSVPLHKRPAYQALFVAVFGISSVLGPIVGGVLTSNVSWRWCFYINLPIGAVVMVIICILLKIPDRPETKIPLKNKLAQLDYYGTACFTPGCVCLLLALQWGGTEYDWSNWRIILLLALAAVLIVAFIGIQLLWPDTATIPPRVFKQRSIYSGSSVAFCIGSSTMIFAYYIPVWFQSIKGLSAEKSGIHNLPLPLAVVAASILSGGLTRKVGYYMPFLIAGICVMSIGAGLITTFKVNSHQSIWVGFQFLYGFGMGMAMQAPNLAAQTVLPRKDVSVGTALMFFSQTLGGAIFISAAQNVLSNDLVKNLSKIKGVDYQKTIESGATSLVDVSSDMKPAVLHGFNDALIKVFQIGAIISCLSIIGGLGMEWKDMKEISLKTEPKTAEEVPSPSKISPKSQL